MELLDRLIPQPLATSEEGRRRARLLMGTGLGLFLAHAIGLTIRLQVSPLPGPILSMVLAGMVFYAATPAILHLTRSVEWAGRIFALGFCGLVATTTYLAGGLDAPFVLFLPIVPVLVTFLLDARSGLLAAVFFSVLALVFAQLPAWHPEAPQSALDPSQALRARAVIFVTAMLVVGLVTTLYRRERLRAEDHLERSRGLYRRLFEQSQDAVVMSDPEGRLLDMNRAGLELFGFASRSELDDTSANSLYADPERRSTLLEHLARKGSVRDYESEFVTQKGERIRAEGSTSRIFLSGDQPEILLTILRDVTSKRKHEDERERLLAQLASKNEELERFGAVLSHDLRSPMVTIRGFLDLLAKDLEAGNEQRVARDLATLQGASEKMAALIDDLVALSLLGKKALEPERVSTLDLAREAVELIAGRLAEQDLEVVLDPDLPEIVADPTKLRVVFQNLIDNAVKFSAGSRSRQVRVEAERGDDATVFRIADDGVGIAEEDKRRIFEAFERVDPAKEGTGIGLASVKTAIERHGGRIWVESEGPGRGSRFCFTIPTNVDRG